MDIIITNPWGMTTQEHVDYWAQSARDAANDAERAHARELEAMWQALVERFGGDHVVADLAVIETCQKGTHYLTERARCCAAALRT